MKLSSDSLLRRPVFVRLAVFVTVLLLLWLPLAAPIYWLVNDDNTVSILTMVVLYGEFILLLQLWGRHVYHQPNLLQSYGLEWTRRNGLDLLNGLALGIISLFGLFLLEGILGWLTWKVPTVALLRIFLEGLLVALGVGFAEELLFRGWLLDELQRDYSPKVALWANAILFALLHFIKPLGEVLRTLPGFPGLLLLGLTLIWAKRSCPTHFQFSLENRTSCQPSRWGRLGLPIGLHAGLIWGYYLVNVGGLVDYSNRVPEWLTGVDKNPLAGGMGLLFLSLIALGMWRSSRSTKTRKYGRQ